MDIQPYLDYTEQLFEVYKQIDLKSIDDYHSEKDNRWDSHNFMSYFTDVTRSVSRLEPFVDSDFKMYDDFVLLSGDIKFCAGMLHYLYPHTTSRHDELTSSLLDRRYIMHISWGYQSIYQFWDRIGDLLWHFFSTGLAKDNVYTARVLNNIPNQYKETQAYVALKRQYDLFKEHFDIRNDVVHSFTMGTDLYWQRMSNCNNKVEQQKLLDKMIYYRDVMTQSLGNCINALELALKLILEIKDAHRLRI